jgi:hypothetical protein
MMAATIYLGGDAPKVASALRGIAAATGDWRLRANAAHCAARMRRTMDRRDLQPVVWLLHSARRDTSLPRAERRAAVHGAANLAVRS